VVVDAVEPALDQAAPADLVVVNGVDRVPDAEAVLDRVRRRAVGTVVATSFGALDPALLVDPPRRPRSAQLSFDELVRDGHTHPHADAESVAFTSDRPLDPGRLAAFLEAGPPGVFRSKGVIRFPGAPPYEVQTVGTAIRVRPAPRGLAVAGAALVLLGAGLDADALHASLSRCVATGPVGEHALMAVTRYEVPA
jgi:G3E family GTPase